MGAVVAAVVPKLIPIHAVLDPANRTIIHWSADQIYDSAVCFGIEPQANLFLLSDGLDKPLVIWYHSVGALAFMSSLVSTSL